MTKRTGVRQTRVTPVSGVALETVRQRLGSGPQVRLIHDDLLAWTPQRRFDLCHDRAVFHFLGDDAAQQTYLRTMRQALRTGGVVIVGTFASDGPEYCSGLSVARYSAEELSAMLGTDFEVLEQLREEHVTPAGVMQPFTWVAARVR